MSGPEVILYLDLWQTIRDHERDGRRDPVLLAYYSRIISWLEMFAFEVPAA